MTSRAIESTIPYELPQQLHPSLRRVLSYWESLRRGENEMPFWDDVKLTALPDLLGRLLLIDVFADPERFRFSFAGEALSRWSKEPVAGKFADEIEPRTPFDYLRSQCSATVEGRRPTLLHNRSSEAGAFSRLLLPMWGDGQIGMLLGAVDWH
jgi:PAS domain